MANAIYRYEIQYTSEDGPTDVYLRELKVLQETDKTYLTEINAWTKKRVRKDTGNAYAHTTKEAALKHFIRRTYKRIAWFEFWQDECKKAIKLAEAMKNGE